MRKVVLAFLLVAVLLSLFASVAFAGIPEYEDPIPPGAAHAVNNSHAMEAAVHDLNIRQLPCVAVLNAGFETEGDGCGN